MCKKANILFPAMIFFYIVGSLLLGMFFLSTGITLGYWMDSILSKIILLIPVVIFMAINKINPVKCLPYRKIKLYDAFLSLMLGYCLVPVILLISNLSTFLVNNYVSDSMPGYMDYPFLIQILLIAVLPALVEEFVFRGVFYHSYRKNGILGAAVVSGLIFGLFHLNLNQFCYAFIMGVVFALLVEATGNMWTSVLAHFAVNTFSITVNKILVVLGYGIESTGEAAADAAGEAANSYVMTEMPAGVYAAELVILAGVALAFLVLAYQIIRVLARRNGRENYMAENLKYGMKPRNGEKFFDVSFVSTSVAIAVFMIFFEVMNSISV